jgi:hypothetical protein
LSSVFLQYTKKNAWTLLKIEKKRKLKNLGPRNKSEAKLIESSSCDIPSDDTFERQTYQEEEMKMRRMCGGNIKKGDRIAKTLNLNCEKKLKT